MFKTTITLSTIAIVLWQIIEKFLLPIPLPLAPVSEPYAQHSAAAEPDLASQLANLKGLVVSTRATMAAEAGYQHERDDKQDATIKDVKDTADAASASFQSVPAMIAKVKSEASCPNVTDLENRTKELEAWRLRQAGTREQEEKTSKELDELLQRQQKMKDDEADMKDARKKILNTHSAKSDVFTEALSHARKNGTKVLIYWSTKAKPCPGCEYFNEHGWNPAVPQLKQFDCIPLLVELWPKLSAEVGIASTPGVTVISPTSDGGYDHKTFIGDDLPRTVGPFVELVRSVN